MNTELVQTLTTTFEANAQQTERGIEYWLARDLQHLLGYDEWWNFTAVIIKAKTACEVSGHSVRDHFVDVNKTIKMPKSAEKEIPDLMLTRYACYLVAQNGDPKKQEIAFAQTYFAVQTRRAELIEQRLLETERVSARKKLSTTEKELSEVIFEQTGGNENFAISGLFAALGWSTVSALEELIGRSRGDETHLSPAESQSLLMSSPTIGLGRGTKGEAVLVSRLRAALERLNPALPPDATTAAVDELTRDGSAMSHPAANREIYMLLKDGIRISIPEPEDSPSTVPSGYPHPMREGQYRGRLTRSYTPDLYRQKCSALFEYVYESYLERDSGLYAAAACR